MLSTHVQTETKPDDTPGSVRNLARVVHCRVFQQNLLAAVDNDVEVGGPVQLHVWMVDLHVNSISDVKGLRNRAEDGPETSGQARAAPSRCGPGIPSAAGAGSHL